MDGSQQFSKPRVEVGDESAIGAEILSLGRAAAARLWLRLADDGHVPAPSLELRDPLARRGAGFDAAVEALGRCWPRDLGTALGRLFALLDGDVELLALLAIAAAPALDGGLARTYDALALRGQISFGLLLDLAAATESERLRLGARIGASPLVTRALIEFDPMLGVASSTPIHVASTALSALRGTAATMPTLVTDAVPPGQWTDVDLAAVGFPDDLRAPLLLTGTSPLALETVARVLRLVRLAEFKRKQAAPGLKVTDRAFGTGWRMPIAATLT